MRQRDDWHLTDKVQHQLGRGDPFAAAIRGTRMPMIITDPRQEDDPIVFANVAFQELSGYALNEILGRNCRFLQGPDTDPAAIAQIREALRKEVAVQVDVLNYRKDGSAFWNALYLSPVPNDDGEVQFYFASQLDVTDRVEAQRQMAAQKEAVEREVEARTADLRAALEAKTLLLHEVDHRVKNNLTMIAALVRLQMRSIDLPEIRDRLDAMLERVDALGTVHRRLYQTDDITQIDIAALTCNLVDDIVGASGRTNIAVKMDVEPVMVPSNAASAAGLIINEIVTNAIKHAYADGRNGLMTLTVRAEGNKAIISFADDGPGLPPSDKIVDGMGSTLIARLSRQIDATIVREDARPGTRIIISLPRKV